MNNRDERRLQKLRERLTYYEHSLAKSTVPSATEGYKRSIRALKKTIKQLEGRP